LSGCAARPSIAWSTCCANRVSAMLRLAYGICEHSLSAMVANSMPRIFSVRSLSSSPPNHSCAPFSNVANQSVLSSLNATPGNASRITLGNVSSTTDDLIELNRKRNIACRLLGAFSARITRLRTTRNVLPEREPPTSRMCLAPLAKTACASCCLAVS
jgi:hypothetical protein